MTELTIISPQNTRFKARKYPKPTSSPKPHRIILRGKLKPKKPKRGNLVKKLDAIFSLYIRAKYGNTCYTCEKKGQMQNGHYVSRSVRTTRWLEDNCRPQCYGCNIMHGGRPIDFREHLIKDLGEKRVKEIEEMRKQLFAPKDSWLIQQIFRYEQKLASVTVKL